MQQWLIWQGITNPPSPSSPLRYTTGSFPHRWDQNAIDVDASSASPQGSTSGEDDEDDTRPWVQDISGEVLGKNPVGMDRITQVAVAGQPWILRMRTASRRPALVGRVGLQSERVTACAQAPPPSEIPPSQAANVLRFVRPLSVVSGAALAAAGTHVRCCGLTRALLLYQSPSVRIMSTPLPQLPYAVAIFILLTAPTGALLCERTAKSLKFCASQRRWVC